MNNNSRNCLYQRALCVQDLCTNHNHHVYVSARVLSTDSLGTVTVWGVSSEILQTIYRHLLRLQMHYLRRIIVRT